MAQSEPWLEHYWRSLERCENGCPLTVPTWPSLRGFAKKNGRSSTNKGMQMLLGQQKAVRLKAVIAAKGALTNYWLKGLNTYVHYISVFSF